MTTNTNPESVAALWPGGESAVPAILPAPRLDSVDGKRIAFLWDYMFRGEEIFPMLEEHIRSKFANTTFVGYEAFGSIFGDGEHAALEALPDRLKNLNIDAVISGNGC